MRRAFSVLLHTSFVMCAAARDFFGGAGSGWAVTAFLRRELEGQCRENGFGIGSWVLIKSDGFPLLFDVTLLCGNVLHCEFDERGMTITADTAGGPRADPPTYECVSSALMRESPAFAAAFNARLTARLSALAARRESDEEEAPRRVCDSDSSG